MPPSPATKKRKSESQITEETHAFKTNVKGKKMVHFRGCMNVLKIKNTCRKNSVPQNNYFFIFQPYIVKDAPHREDEHPATSLFREYIRIKSVQPDPDYGKLIHFSGMCLSRPLLLSPKQRH